MANSIVRNKLRARIDGALGEISSSDEIDHTGIRGGAAESAVRELIGDLLPKWAEVGTGKVIDRLGGQSRQIDTALYSSFVLPPVLVHKAGDDLLIPVEACISTVEIKSKLTATELQKAIDNAISVKSLDHIRTRDENGHVDPPRSPTCCLLALSSDLSEDGKTELKRYLDRDAKSRIDPALNMICVLGRGIWLFGASKFSTHWQYTPASNEHDEIIDFLSVLANSVPHWRKQAVHIAAGHYFIEPRPFRRLYDNGRTTHFDSQGKVVQ